MLVSTLSSPTAAMRAATGPCGCRTRCERMLVSSKYSPGMLEVDRFGRSTSDPWKILTERLQRSEDRQQRWSRDRFNDETPAFLPQDGFAARQLQIARNPDGLVAAVLEQADMTFGLHRRARPRHMLTYATRITPHTTSNRCSSTDNATRTNVVFHGSAAALVAHEPGQSAAETVLAKSSPERTSRSQNTVQPRHSNTTLSASTNLTFPQRLL